MRKGNTQPHLSFAGLAGVDSGVSALLADEHSTISILLLLMIP
jgi:hypothetical protein